jgi:hypothetical protein
MSADEPPDRSKSALRGSLVFAGIAWAAAITGIVTYVGSGGGFPAKNEGEAVFMAFTLVAGILLGACPALVGFVLAIVGYVRAEENQNVALRRFALCFSGAYAVPVLVLLAR